MKPLSDRDIRNRLQQAADSETPPLWGRIEAKLQDDRYSFEAEEIPAARKMWRKPLLAAVAVSLFLVLAVGLTALYPMMAPPVSPSEERIDLSFQVRSEVLGNVDYGLEGNRSESLRLLETYADFQNSLARIGLLIDDQTSLPSGVPYPQPVKADLPYTEEYFQEHALLMLLYPWETAYAAEDVARVTKTGTVLTVGLSSGAPSEDAFAGLRQALFVEVNKADIEDCDRFVFEVQAAKQEEVKTLETARYQTQAVEVDTDNTAANRVLTSVQDVADLQVRLSDNTARKMLDQYDAAYFEDHDLITLYLRHPSADIIQDIVGVTKHGGAENALDIVLTERHINTYGTKGRICCLELPKGTVSADTILYLYNAFQGNVTVLIDTGGDDMTVLELIQEDPMAYMQIDGTGVYDLSTSPMLSGGISVRLFDSDGDGVKDLSISLDWMQPQDWTQPPGTKNLIYQKWGDEWRLLSETLVSEERETLWFSTTAPPEISLF